MSQNDWQNDNAIVVDTNTVLSALIGGATRTLIVELNRTIYYPEPSYEEIQRNRGVIQDRSGLDATTVDTLIETIFKNVELVPEVEIVQEYSRAANAVSPVTGADRARTFAERDSDDVPFLAAAIAIGTGIWSDDGVFKHQDFVPWFRTTDVIEHSSVDL